MQDYYTISSCLARLLKVNLTTILWLTNANAMAFVVEKILKSDCYLFADEDNDGLNIGGEEGCSRRKTLVALLCLSIVCIVLLAVIVVSVTRKGSQPQKEESTTDHPVVYAAR